MSEVNVQTYATLDDAVKAGGVYIINNTDARGTRKKGVLIFHIQTQDGSKTPIKIPPTWIPINLVNSATLEDLQRCTTLRQYIGRQILIAITPESVEKLKASPGYAMEEERVSKLLSGFETSVAPTTMTINTAGSGILKGDKVDPNGVANTQVSSLVQKTLAAQSNQQIVAILDSELKNISVMDAQQLGIAAASGSFLERLSSELEGYLTEDDNLPFNSLEETDTVALAKSDGTFSAPSLSF